MIQPGQTRLSDFPDRRNSLNLLRLVLAASVIVSHAWPLGGFGPDPHLGQLALGHFAVAGFFAISGWLITQSRLSSELPAFAWRRFLRIYPGYWVALLAVAFVFAPIGSALGAGSYSLSDGARHVLSNFTLRMRDYSVGGTPENIPYPAAWNGSLWTLFHELACYVIVALAVTVVARRWVRPAIITLFLLLTVARVVTAPEQLPADLGAFLSLAPFFFAGAAVFLVREHIPLRWEVAVGSLVWLGLVIGLDVDTVLAAPALIYLLLWLGAGFPFQAVGRRNDISYGVYIYAFPVQQLLFLLGVADWGVWGFAGVSIVCTVPLAVLSWFAVERPALRYKRAADRFPLVRRGWSIQRRQTAAAG